MTRKTQFLIVLGLIGLIFPLETLHAIAWVGHYLYEWIEYGLDLLLHHAFGLERRTTQILVFYLMTLPMAYLSFRLLKRLWASYFQLKRQLNLYQRQLAENYPIKPAQKSLPIALGMLMGVTFIGWLSF